MNKMRVMNFVYAVGILGISVFALYGNNELVNQESYNAIIQQERRKSGTGM